MDENKIKHAQNTINKFAGIIFVIFGVMVLIGSIFVYQDCKDFQKTSKGTTATVTNVDRHTESKTVRSNGHTRHKNVTVYTTSFEYKVNGETFNSSIDFSHPMQNGDTFAVWYDENNPQDVRNNNGSYVLPGIIVSMGIVLLGLGIVTFKISVSKGKTKDIQN